MTKNIYLILNYANKSVESLSKEQNTLISELLVGQTPLADF